MVMRALTDSLLLNCSALAMLWGPGKALGGPCSQPPRETRAGQLGDGARGAQRRTWVGQVWGGRVGCQLVVFPSAGMGMGWRGGQGWQGVRGQSQQ